MDVSKICRSCTQDIASWVKENFDKRIIEMFCSITDVKITEDDILPKQFCYDCIIKIQVAHTFIHDARKADVTLRNIVSRSHNSVIIEPDNITKNENINLTVENYESLQFEYNEENLDSCEDGIILKYEPNKPLGRIEQGKIISKELLPAGYNKSKKNVCSACQKVFTSVTWFVKHTKKCKTEHISSYSCPNCPKTFSKPSQLEAHSIFHSGERLFRCKACNKWFQRQKLLTEHMKGHCEARPYACDKCHMRFKLKGILRSHLKQHNDVKQYLCTECGASFHQACNLKTHMRRHSGDKPYACKVCNFRAAASANLRRHQKLHANARSHICTLCHKGFYEAGALTRHMRTHTGELPYACPSCPRAFIDSWKRKRHLMHAHRLQLEDIPRMRRDGVAVPAPP